MSIKRGNVVTHSGAVEWGVGIVLEATPLRVSIKFNDGTIRKIACSHFINLQPADPASYLPVSEAVPAATGAAPKKPRKAKVVKQPAV